MKIPRQEILDSLPVEWPEPLLNQIRAAVERSGTRLVVLDDDPTGTQTVYQTPVLTTWGVPELVEVFEEPHQLIYLLTNTRSMPEAQARAINTEIARNLLETRRITGRDFSVISRSDSTLRGHFPAEVEALIAGLRMHYDAVLIIPYFAEGGRFTVADIHYVAEGEDWIPAAETEYARDAYFGYAQSNLREWASHKFRARIAPQDIASIGLETIRLGGPQAVADQLSRLANAQPCIVNAAADRDLEVFVAGLLRAELAGKRFLSRTAASFVRVRAGLDKRPLLGAGQLTSASSGAGGLIVAGSYIEKSTRQIESLAALPGIASLEVSVADLFDPARRSSAVERTAAEASAAILAGKDALIYTSRQLMTGSQTGEALEIGKMVSQSLVQIVRALAARPAWVIAKGGITSSDIATQAINVRRAQVLGQVLPGVPVWRTAPDSRWPDLIYIVFPGNVGHPDSLRQVVELLHLKVPGVI